MDVNSGSFHKKGIDQADMAFLTNREAAGEIARQIRMRGIGGMILIDFIDMESTARKKQIVDILKKETARDRVKNRCMRNDLAGSGGDDPETDGSPVMV